MIKPLNAVKVLYDQTYGIFIGLAFCLALPAMPLGGPVTTTRVALALIVILTISKLHNIKKITLPVYMPLVATTVAGGAYFISYLLNDGNVWFAFSWIFLGILCVAIAFCVSQMQINHLKQMVWVVWVSAMFIWIIVFYHMVLSDVPLSGSAASRFWIGRFIPLPGINRFMNMMVIMSGIAWGALYFGFIKKRFLQALFVLPGIITFYFAILSGSRQSMIAILFLAVLLIVFKTKNTWKTIAHIAIFIAFLILITLGAIKLGVIDGKWIERRFIAGFTEGITKTETKRVHEIGTSWQYTMDGGTGPGAFFPKTGLYPHNGYLYFLAETGIFTGGIALALVWAVIVAIYFYQRRKGPLPPIGKTTWVVFIVLATVMNVFNDLFREPIYWAVLGLAVGASEVLPSNKEQINQPTP